MVLFQMLQLFSWHLLRIFHSLYNIYIEMFCMDQSSIPLIPHV